MAERRKVEARRLRRRKRFQELTDHAGERAGGDLTTGGGERITGTDDNQD